MKNQCIFFICVFFGLLGCFPYSRSHHFMTSDIITDDEPVFCSDPKSFYKSKMLFVLDKTKSNKKSDPNGNVRTQGLKSFIQKHQAEHIHYGLIHFNSQPASLSVQYDIPVFTPSAQKINELLDQLQSQPDKGKEDYLSILSLIEKTLRYDIQISSTPLVDYHIFYISDGSYSESQAEGERMFVQGIQRLVRQMPNVQVHTVYYGNYKNRRPTLLKRTLKGGQFLLQTYFMMESGFFNFRGRSSSVGNHDLDTDDVHLLKNISQKGGGSHTDYNQQSDILFRQKLIEPWSLERFVVYNLNAGFCLNGYVGVDSDADGLCDQDEEALPGFHANNRFSFGDGYSDYFHWLALNKQQILPACKDQTDADYDLLTRCEEEYLNATLWVQGKGFKPLKINHADSDGDSIIDGIEALVFLSSAPSAPLDPHNLFQTRRGEESDLDKILKHISPYILSSEQRHYAYDTTLTPISGENFSCYGIQQSVLPLYPTVSVNNDDTLSNISHKAGENVIFVYSLQKKKTLKRHYLSVYL